MKATKRRKATKSQFLNEFAEKLKTVRAALDATLVDVADGSLGVLMPSLVSSYEQGTEPTLSKFIALCIATGMRPEQLLPKAVTDMFDGKPGDRMYFKRRG